MFNPGQGLETPIWRRAQRRVLGVESVDETKYANMPTWDLPTFSLNPNPTDLNEPEAKRPRRGATVSEEVHKYRNLPFFRDAPSEGLLSIKGPWVYPSDLLLWVDDDQVDREEVMTTFPFQPGTALTQAELHALEEWLEAEDRANVAPETA